MKKVCAAALVLFLTGATGCGAQQGGISKETGGAVIGGIAGGVLGSRIGKGRGRTIATIAGAIIGGLAGGAIGKQLDERDKLLMARSTQDTLERGRSGQTSEWRNPDSGHSGTVTPKPAYQMRSGPNQGQYCREFQQTVSVGGKSEQAYGTACRQPDGSWKIVQ